MDYIDELEEDEFKKSYTLSSFDKLDWRRRIDEQMWRCIQAEKKYGRYHIEVIKLENCVCTNFYGLDFATPIKENIEAINQALEEQLKNSLPKMYYYHPKTMKDLTCFDRSCLELKIYDSYWHFRFEFVRDILAKNRGLLWGSRQIPGGEQMKGVNY